MPSKLNFQAKEWLPPGGLSKQFRSTPGEQDEAAYGGTAQISQDEGNGSAQNISADTMDTLGTKQSDIGSRDGNIEQSRSLSSNSDILGDTDELQFEEVFDPHNTSERSSPRSTPKASLVGPSPLPSPVASPHTHTCASLMKQTERLSLALEAKRGELSSRSEKEIENEKEEPTVTTHVETETSAAASGSSSKKLGPDDFELLRVVGQGAFGKVFQVRKTGTGEIFAMKVMKKDRILEKSHGEYVRAERNALTSVVHPYIVTLRYSFQTKKKLYLVLDFINGGHLFFQLYRAGTFDEDLARLYTAELVSAISHLHSLGFVHRDLKPENVLLDAQGHVKVTDFGLAKGNMSDAEHHRTNSFIGTMEYMAPEVIQGKGHGKAVDWWSTGILLYEMLCGMPPFRAKSRPALQKLIVSGKFKLPPYLSSDACSILKGLLQKDASKRLGFGDDGSSAVKKHPFFKTIDWKKLDKRDIRSPFRPNLQSHESVENFDKIWTDLPPHDSPCSTPTKGSLGENGEFDGFTYVAPSLLAQFSPGKFH
ncbi:hypothetical protein M9435_005877 [Picochlorum sp. BPE23]|nr:hypothetical protein M9435_005877 [Picochlorum sp. BPE23]